MKRWQRFATAYMATLAGLFAASILSAVRANHKIEHELRRVNAEIGAARFRAALTVARREDIPTADRLELIRQMDNDLADLLERRWAAGDRGNE